MQQLVSDLVNQLCVRRQKKIRFFFLSFGTVLLYPETC